MGVKLLPLNGMQCAGKVCVVVKYAEVRQVCVMFSRCVWVRRVCVRCSDCLSDEASVCAAHVVGVQVGQ